MSDDDSKKPALTSGDLPGLSSHFSTTLTGLAPLRRKRRATTSGEVPPGEASETTPPTSDEAPPDPAGAQESTEPLTEVHDGPDEPPAGTADPEAIQETTKTADPAVVDPLEGIELRPGLSLVDTAEIPIHKAQAAAKLRSGKPIDRPARKPAPPRPPAPSPPAYDDEPSSARISSPRHSSGLGWIYVAVILLIAVLIGALLFQVADLM